MQEDGSVNKVIGKVDGFVVQAGIIAGDVYLHAEHRPVTSRQLPRPVWRFIGRKPELAAITARVASAPGGVVAIDGTAGVGKTALALHWAWQEHARFPDGQLYLDLHGFNPQAPMTIAEAIRRFLHALQVPADRVPLDIDAQIELYRSLVMERRMVVVLDNARDSDHVRPLLPGSSSCVVLTTSRKWLAGLVAREQANLINFTPLSTDEARQLLATFLDTDRLCEGIAVANLIKQCANLPIALTIAAARAITRPAVLIASLADEMSSFATGDGVDSDLAAVFPGPTKRYRPELLDYFDF